MFLESVNSTTINATGRQQIPIINKGKAYFAECRKLSRVICAKIQCDFFCRMKGKVQNESMRNVAEMELQTFRTQDLSYPRPFVPKNERSLWRTFVPQERKFPGTFVPGERKFLRTFVPGTFRTRELSFPLSDRPSRRFALCA